VARSTGELLSSGESKGESLGSGGSFFLFLRVMAATGKQFAQRTEFSLMFSHYLSLSREFSQNSVYFQLLETCIQIALASPPMLPFANE